MIIFGWGRRTVRNVGPIFVRECPNCHNTVTWRLVVARSWLTLFFIPVIPYRREYLMVCPVCEYSVELDKRQYEGTRKKIEEGTLRAVK